jgi:alkaline phosphatase D
MHYRPRIITIRRAVFQDLNHSGNSSRGRFTPEHGAGRARQHVGPAAMFLLDAARQGKIRAVFWPEFFGRVDIDGRSGIMTVTLKDVDDRALWSIDIEPRPDARPGGILGQHI